MATRLTFIGPNWIYARQLSKQSGEIYCEVKGDRVLLSGRAVKFMEGDIIIP